VAIFVNATFLLVYVILNDALSRVDHEKSVELQLQSKKNTFTKVPLLNLVLEIFHPLIIVPVTGNKTLFNVNPAKSGFGLSVSSKYTPAKFIFEPNKYDPLITYPDGLGPGGNGV